MNMLFQNFDGSKLMMIFKDFLVLNVLSQITCDVFT